MAAEVLALVKLSGVICFFPFLAKVVNVVIVAQIVQSNPCCSSFVEEKDLLAFLQPATPELAGTW